MKYLKLFSIVAIAALFFVSCSEKWQPTSGMTGTLNGYIGTFNFNNEPVRFSLSNSDYGYQYFYINDADGQSDDYYMSFDINETLELGKRIYEAGGGVDSDQSVAFNYPGWRDATDDSYDYWGQTIFDNGEDYFPITVEITKNSGGTIQGIISGSLANKENKADVIDFEVNFMVENVDPNVNPNGSY